MNRRDQKTRSGTIVICVLVCLLVSSALVAQVAQSALRARREVRLRQQLRQTDYLLDAGVMRAVHQLQERPDYSGERWRPSEALPRFNEALVNISVANTDDANVRRVKVVASLHASAESVSAPAAGRTQRTHTFPYQLPKSSTEE